MANNDIEIGLHTKADTSGATAAAKSLVDLEKIADDTRERQAEAARQEADAAQAAQQAEDTAAIRRKTTALVFGEIEVRAKQAAAGIREFANEINEIDPEFAEKMEGVAKGFDLAGAAAQGAMMGGPIGAVLMPGIQLVRSEIEEAIKSAANLKQVEKIGEKLDERMREVKAKMDMREEVQSWEKLTEQMRSAVEQLEFMAESDAIKKDAKVKIAELDLRAAKASGGDVATAEKNLQYAKEDALTSGEENKLKIMMEKQRLAIIERQAKEAELFGINANFYKLSAEGQAKASKDMEELRGKIAELSAKVTAEEKNIERYNERQSAEADIAARKKPVEDLEKGQQTTVQSLGNLVKEVETKGGGDENIQQAIAALKKAMADSTLDPKELDDITLILARNRQGMLQLGVSFQVLDQVNQNMNALINELQKQLSISQELGNRIRGLEAAREGVASGFRITGE